MNTSHIHCGTPDNFQRVRDALLVLRVDHLQLRPQEMTVYVQVPEGSNPDEHQDALTALANAVTA